MRKGKCYENAFHLLEKFKGFFVLCHGVCIGTGPTNNGKPFGHAWIENQITVIDGGRGVTLSKVVYYKLGQIRNVKRFTWEQAQKRALKYKHYGPWNPEIVKAESWINP